MLNKATNEQPLVLNVNGGIIKRRPGWCDNNTMFGLNPTNRFARIVVYEEGMTLDTNGKDVRQIAETPFEGADGNGIMRIDLGGEVTGLIGAPRVDIENTENPSGNGATAVAIDLLDYRIVEAVNGIVSPPPPKKDEKGGKK